LARLKAAGAKVNARPSTDAKAPPRGQRLPLSCTALAVFGPEPCQRASPGTSFSAFPADTENASRVTPLTQRLTPTMVPMAHDELPGQFRTMRKPKTTATMPSKRIEGATDRLPQGQREAVLLKDVAGLSYQQIATVSGESIQAIKSSVRQARLSLQETINRFYCKH